MMSHRTSAGARSRTSQSSRLAPIALALLVAACSDASFSNLPATPSLDAQIRSALSGWGVVPILPVNAQDPALVDLGRSLFFDKILSGNRDVACASCHNPLTHTDDALSLAIGTGALGAGTTRTLGAGRQFTPRNAPSLLSAGLRSVYLFWDGRVSENGGGPSRFTTPAGAALPAGLTSLLAAQAMIPVTNRVEMRGNAGDHDVFGNVNELAQPADTQYAEVWNGAMQRVLSISAYMQKFVAAYPSVPQSQLGFQHAANAIAAYEVETFTKVNSPFDRYLARDDNALSIDAKRGALLFFGKARCSQCHNGPRLGGEFFANIAAPQLGPGTGSAAPLDAGRGDLGVVAGPPEAQRFSFRVPPL
ncbi:MAG TPA: cytochrome c peroxidase, partial [Gemmatimonadaceae bacterium]|nr:cytochrome c peroxidase [Gemmatimonadaceae bacterium]